VSRTGAKAAPIWPPRAPQRLIEPAPFPFSFFLSFTSQVYMIHRLNAAEKRGRFASRSQ